MSSYTTKFNINDTAYRIYHDNPVSVSIVDIYIHDSLKNVGSPEISYKVSYSLNASGVGNPRPGPTLFNESELFYLDEITNILTVILAQKAANLQALQ